MAAKSIVWSSRANSELQEIFDYYNKRNRSTVYSYKLLEKTELLLRTLSQNEFIGRPTTNGRIRVIPLDAYLIFYEIVENSIHVLSFWDNRQDVKNRLLL